MIEFTIVSCDTNHANYSRSTVHANDIDAAGVKAVADCSGRRFIVAVLEADHCAGVAAFVGGTMDARRRGIEV